MFTHAQRLSSPCRTSVVARGRRVAQEVPLHAGNVAHAAHVVSLGESLQVVEQFVGVDAELGQFLEVEREVIGRRVCGQAGPSGGQETQPYRQSSDGHRSARDTCVM